MKQFFTKISRRAWIIIGVVAAVVLAVVFFSTRGSAEPLFQTAAVERGNLVAMVGATGSVRARQSAILIWQTTGVVKDIYKEVGTPVKRDEILASLDKNSLNQSVILAESDLASAKKALEDLLSSDTARAQALRAVDTAEEAYKKAYNYRLELNGLISITETYLVRGVPKVRTYKGYADAETIADADEKLALAEAQLKDARRNLDRLQNGVDPADLAAAEGRIAAAQSTLNMAHIIAPFDGTITQAEPSIGDQVTAGTVAFRIDDVSHMLVDLQVSEVDINNVTIGQPATLTFDAILTKEYHGKVVEVGQAGDTVQGVVSFTVTVELTDADELVKPGMTAAVNVVIEEQKDVLLIPNRAVRLVDGERVVYVLVDGQPVQVKIKLGTSSDTMSVLVGGDIKEGDQIILNPPSNNGGPFGG
ncbi:MAG: efflux RND transporter periplasmic adaptor subunit [Anaerolineales bacterium]|jgi:HlyD family secretion protein|uniref:efflux RND transporter periplasmic adaptor subunit n=1 Tax=Candidatus Villigracilis affinis TaxID=3140682 RepID=UPI001B425BF1|nr:efflux RND transporter periplasmic adaptor subunit [Anaerolineales bacterium]MBK9603236.1 efflux RND transporter periplasmic adaptor subunit [Anaerolineales bacterium]MBL0346394.1 efflux RND transporter periplasmic adaptor subunit [Anaerolineales bacterium]MBP8048084.1 efflux RND transporter periplasmic adaptor subunit [Anaerolineales bacterium]